jgi:hypothetical protein
MARRDETGIDGTDGPAGCETGRSTGSGEPSMSDDLRSAQLLHAIAGVLGVTPDVFLCPDRYGIETGGEEGEDAALHAYSAGASRLLRLYRDLPDQNRRDQALRMVEELFESDAK